MLQNLINLHLVMLFVGDIADIQNVGAGESSVQEVVYELQEQLVLGNEVCLTVDLQKYGS